MDKSLKRHVKWTEARHKRLQIVWFHLYEIPRKGKTVEMKRIRDWLGLENWEQRLIAEHWRDE